MHAVSERKLYPEIQKTFQRELLTRFELFLDVKRGLIEERNRLQLELARSLTNDMIIQDQHRRMIARRMEMVRQLIEIQSTLKEIGVPGEIVERKIGQYVDRLIDTLGTELTTGGNHGTLER